jgi:predicted O-linked N-acetylglucosamine transferase (SPINDLY family)
VNVAVSTEPTVLAVALQQALALYRHRQYASAEALLSDILVRDPGCAHALHLLGLICEQRNDLDMAEGLLRRALTLSPHSRVAHNLGVVLMRMGRLDEAIVVYRQAIALEPDYAEAWTNLLFALDYHPFSSPELLRAERAAFDRACCCQLTAASPRHTNDPNPERPLRVGYISADFRTTHSAAGAFAWIPSHDPAAVESYLYSNYPGADPTDAVFKAAAEVWSEVSDLSTLELAGAIRADKIDILVDLSSVSEGGRPLVMAARSAPIQLSGWGYPHGLGIRALDYLASDDVAIPPDHDDRYREQILRLPTLMTYSPGRTPDVGVSPEHRLGYRTYGYLGRAMKLNDQTLATWAELLRADPTSRLLLKSPQYDATSMRNRVAAPLLALGITHDRIEVRAGSSRESHLAAYHDIDVALDPFPIGGGATTLDACWMGVPTVCMLGENVSGRISGSILTTIGADAWIAPDRDAYIQYARTRSTPERAHLREQLAHSIICDLPRYARWVEDAYRGIWRDWCQRQWGQGVPDA